MSQKRSYETAYRFSINFCADVLVEDAENLFSKFHESIYAPTLVLRQKCKVYCYCFLFFGKARNSKGIFMISARNVPENAKSSGHQRSLAVSDCSTRSAVNGPKERPLGVDKLCRHKTLLYSCGVGWRPLLRGDSSHQKHKRKWKTVLVQALD